MRSPERTMKRRPTGSVLVITCSEGCTQISVAFPLETVKLRGRAVRDLRDLQPACGICSSSTANRRQNGCEPTRRFTENKSSRNALRRQDIVGGEVEAEIFESNSKGN